MLNLFDTELQLINIKPMIKRKLKELLGELKKIKVQKILVLEYKKINCCKIFHSSAKLIVSDTDIDEAFKSRHQSIMMKMNNCSSKYWNAVETIEKHSIQIFECQYKHRKIEIISSL